jgi:hypothetical protein
LSAEWFQRQTLATGCQALSGQGSAYCRKPLRRSCGG